MTPSAAQPKTTTRWLVLVAVIVSMSIMAFEATIVSTAMPQIVSDLGGLQLYSWVFSAYLLTQTALTVVFGKLADIYGRRPVALPASPSSCWARCLPGSRGRCRR